MFGCDLEMSFHARYWSKREIFRVRSGLLGGGKTLPLSFLSASQEPYQVKSASAGQTKQMISAAMDAESLTI